MSFSPRTRLASLLAPIALGCGGTSEREVPECRNAWAEIRVPAEFREFHAGAAVSIGGRLYLFRQAPEPDPLVDAPVGLVFDPPDRVTELRREFAPSSFIQLVAALAIERQIVVLTRLQAGCPGSDVTCAGGRYDVDTATWTPIVAPEGSGRIELAVPMSEGEVLTVQRVSGAGSPAGSGVAYFAYTPVDDSWRRLADRSDAAEFASAVSSQGDVVLWGPWQNSAEVPGARYDLAGDEWFDMPDDGAPPATALARVWTGHEVVVWDGSAERSRSGSRYYPDRDAWEPMTEVGAPPAGGDVTVAVGRSMAALGLEHDGSRVGYVYDAESDTWSPLAAQCGPIATLGPTLTRMDDGIVLWGGTPDGCTLASDSEQCRDRAWFVSDDAVLGRIARDEGDCRCPAALGGE